MTIDISQSADTRAVVGNPQTRRKVAALLLALVAGYVNAVLAIVLLDISISHITGDSEDLSIALSQLHTAIVVRMGIPVATFFLGIAVGGAVMELCVRRGLKRRLALMALIESLLIGGFVVSAIVVGGKHTLQAGSSLRLLWLIGLPAAAMGIQTSAVDQIRGRRVRTTFLSGMVARTAQALVRCAFWVRDRMVGKTGSLRDALTSTLRIDAFDRGVFLAGIWILWVGGAAMGALAELRFGALCAGFPITVLLLVGILDLIRPYEFPSPLPQEPDPRADL
ncbi:MAG TPA: YoaK family protein [Actinomycetota bacterium]|jgi:uncharacterized membrane protein YoaK (UPF0700 family)|nr:YoaK family protein [Actinomycetota bacterium]